MSNVGLRAGAPAATRCNHHKAVNEQLNIRVAGHLILARLRGEPTPELLRECQEQVLLLTRGDPVG